MSYSAIHLICINLSNEKRIEKAKRFFKTGPGSYSEKDIFLGITTPECRKISKENKAISLIEIKKLITSKFHEERLIALFILIEQFKMAIKEEDEKTIERLYQFYFRNRKGVNNWDLVDQSAPYLSGYYYFHYKKKDLLKLVQSKDLWERRIAIISMFYFIRNKDYKLPIEMIEKRLFDSEDLMHKACGWMLRELGKRDKNILNKFLNKHAIKMPRTALRYAIEKHSEKEKKFFIGKR